MKKVTQITGSHTWPGGYSCCMQKSFAFNAQCKIVYKKNVSFQNKQNYRPAKPQAFTQESFSLKSAGVSSKKRP